MVFFVHGVMKSTLLLSIIYCESSVNSSVVSIIYCVNSSIYCLSFSSHHSHRPRLWLLFPHWLCEQPAAASRAAGRFLKMVDPQTDCL